MTRIATFAGLVALSVGLADPAQGAFVLSDLGTLGGSHSYARAINSMGQVVGESYTASTASHGFLWQNGTMTDFGTLLARGINDSGEVAGTLFFAGSGPRAVLWDSSRGITNLGTLGGISSYATGVNEQSQVVGYSRTVSGAGHAFLWDSDSGMRDLGTLGGSNSLASALNNAGQVVGWSYATPLDPVYYRQHAFLWSDGTMIDQRYCQ
ncbi:MAG: hypothetical protein ACYC35_21095 [Pirellulales bacterium]